MLDEDFHFLSSVAFDISGIVLSEQKKELVYSRISRRIRSLGLTNFKQYCEHLNADQSKEVSFFLNSITTNLTSFFRESHHFEYLAKTVIPELKRKGTSHPIRIWSAACSTGPEPYSIAITLSKNMPIQNYNIKILATDLDSDVLAKAKAGEYSLDDLEQLPKDYLNCFERKEKLGIGRIKPSIRELIQFNRLNLLGPWPMQSTFDIVFCRNVVIYFNKETQRELFDRIANAMNDGAYLFIGHSETLHGITDRFESIGRTIYKKVK